MSDDLPDPLGDIEPPDWALVVRYLSGEATSGDAARFRAWLNNDPRHPLWLDAVRELWNAAGRPIGREIDGGQIADTVWARVKDVDASTERVRPVPRTRRPMVIPAPRPTLLGQRRGRAGISPFRRVAGVAAAVAVIVGGTVAAWRAGWLHQTQQIRELVSAPGSRVTVVLRDGTRLVLGPATHLRVPADFGASTRTVELDGEALFAVTHNARQPFTVRTRRTTVQDVGTTFSVRAYAVDSDQQVAVAEGEVMLSGVALHPSDIASTDSAGRTTVQRGVSVTEAFAWTQGVLAFRDTPLRDVVRALSRTYDLDVSVADPALAAKLVTASFNNRTAEEVLTAVSLAVGGHVERTGRTAVIRDGIAQTGTKSRAGTEQRITRAEAKQ